MTLDEIVAGLEYRLKELEDAHNAMYERDRPREILADYEGRIDELESILTWIKENSQ